MSEVQNFEEFYSSRIEPLVLEHDSNRRSSSSWSAIMFFLVFVFLFACGTALFSDMDGKGTFWFLSLVALIFSIHQYSKASDAYEDGFKDKVVKQIVDFVLPGNVYKPGGYMSSKLFAASCLHRERLNIGGDDFVKAQYKNIPFRASELYTSTPDDDSKWPLFKGIFFAADLGRFEGGTYIWPADDIQLGNSIADEHYRMHPIPKVYNINSGSQVFDKYYAVYSSYPAEAHTILTEEFMQRVLDFRRQLKKDFRMSFVAGRFYLTIPFEERLLETGGDLRDKSLIKEYFFTILLYPAIINQLRLYEYI